MKNIPDSSEESTYKKHVPILKETQGKGRVSGDGNSLDFGW